MIESTASGLPRSSGGNVGQMLDLAHDVVAEVADETAVQRRQLGQHRRSVVREHRLDRGEHTAIERDAVGQRLIDLDSSVPPNERRDRPPADERPAPPALVLDRLEQEAGLVADDAQEPGDRGRQIAQHLAPHGHHRVIARERVEISPRGLRAHGEVDVENARKKQENSPVWQAPLPCCSTTNNSTSPSQS